MGRFGACLQVSEVLTAAKEKKKSAAERSMKNLDKSRRGRTLSIKKLFKNIKSKEEYRNEREEKLSYDTKTSGEKNGVIR